MFMMGQLITIGMLLAGLSLFGGYQLTTRMDVEYEYIFTNGEVDVDKIIAPAAKGTYVGKMNVYNNGKLISTVYVVTAEPAEEGVFSFIYNGHVAHPFQLALLIILFVLILFVGESLLLNRNKNDIPDEPAVVIIEDNTPEPMPALLKDEWLTNKAINPDFVGCIKFDSGLIDLPFVQATDVYDRYGKPYTFYTEDGQLVEDIENYTGNDVYIWTNWKTGEYDKYNEGGSVFMDYRNNLNDQNLIIYGHHFARDWDPSGSKQFTPLDALLEQENYKVNKSLKLILNNEIREYVITNVFTININNDYELNIMRRNMNEDYSGNPDPGFFQKYIQYIDGINKYPIDEKLSDGDNILTLVTCMQHQPELRQIIIAKEIDKTIYD